jgi:photosystem II stability/assembly factor-like uncharacterized protein
VFGALLPASASAFNSSGDGWNLQDPGMGIDLHAVDFADINHGWAAGTDSTGAGLVLATADGGTTWSKQDVGTVVDFTSVSAPDAAHAWVAGYANPRTGNSTIVATTDGGATWNSQDSGATTMLRDVHLADSLHGWLLDIGTILHTDDGGATWSKQSKTFTWCVAVDSVGSLRAWAVGLDGTILVTADGGTTWTPQTSGTAADLMAVSFADALHGWVAGYGGTILATTDGGLTWTDQSLATTVPIVSSVSAPDASHCWVACSNGTLLATSDGGATWNSQVNGGASEVQDVSFASATHGWSVGSVILNTTTGGLVPAPTISGLSMTSGPVGGSVVLNGANFTRTTAVSFHGTAASFTVDSNTHVTAVVPPGATSGAITVTTPGGSAASSDFTVIHAPSVRGFTPSSGAVGASVTLTGADLSGATSVRFHGALASFTVISATQIVTTVPANGTTGAVAVTTPGGVATSASSFTVISAPSPATPAITKLSPTSGKRGLTVTITGKNFGKKSSTSYVKFGAAKCAKYLSWSATRIKCKVPAKTDFGKVRVKVVTSAGASKSKAFTVKR